jgi:glycosyltransferase involved in cell wall biosynthesis
MRNKPIILTFITVYLPGYKAGGPLRTIANMVDQLRDEFVFWIVTLDRDLGDNCPYLGIRSHQWQKLGEAKVYYFPPKDLTIKRISNLIANTPHDVLYLNSFFDPIFTLKPLLARKLGWIPIKPVIIAPRGEFSEGAIKLKRLKKYLFIKLSSFFQLYENMTWHASSEHEALDIVRVMNASSTLIHVAPDLPTPKITDSSFDILEERAHLRIVFLSRISPKKNLEYALTVLSEVTASVIFHIYGPIEDANYWQKCKELIKQLPINVSVSYLGSVNPEQVTTIFSRYDLFFFPTKGENYGHVIAESLSVGTAVLLSDQTPWRGLEGEQLGWDIPLQQRHRFVDIIDELLALTPEQRNVGRIHIKKKLAERLRDPHILNSNRELFKFFVED